MYPLTNTLAVLSPGVRTFRPPRTIRQNTKNVFLSISDDYNATSIHAKANLIAYLGTQCGLLLQVVHNFCVNQPISFCNSAENYIHTYITRVLSGSEDP